MSIPPTTTTDGLSVVDHLGIPDSTSSTSSISQYHSAQSSPSQCQFELSSSDEEGMGQDTRQLLTFSSSSGSIFGPDSATSAQDDTSDRRRPRIPIQDSTSTSSDPDSAADDTDEQAPNVYINGLPPHFTEEQLLAIVANFGEVVSVRTFTRGGPSSSGYGFVLFKSMAAAENCIVTLRRSNLYPRLSRVHRPPRIINSSSSSSIRTSSSSSGSSLGNADQGSPVLSFRERMARLEDQKSTNVYIEGLPMSSDKQTLLTLAHPYVIMSSRFMRSKIPNSPTMIAFMRMDTRVAAEAVIAHLNGRTVRGWDGSESKVLLRIADTLDQRELRRAEAAARDGNGDESSDRLSIAGATLLSYRGKEFAAALSQSDSSGSDGSSGGIGTSVGSMMSVSGSASASADDVSGSLFAEPVQTKQPSAILAYPRPPTPATTTTTKPQQLPQYQPPTIAPQRESTQTQTTYSHPQLAHHQLQQAGYLQAQSQAQRQPPPHLHPTQPHPHHLDQRPRPHPRNQHQLYPANLDAQTHAAVQMQMQLQLLQMHPLQVQQWAAAAMMGVGMGLHNQGGGMGVSGVGGRQGHDPLYAPYAHPAPVSVAGQHQHQQQAQIQRRANWRAQSQIPVSQSQTSGTGTGGGLRRTTSGTSGGVPVSFGRRGNAGFGAGAGNANVGRSMSFTSGATRASQPQAQPSVYTAPIGNKTTPPFVPRATSASAFPPALPRTRPVSMNMHGTGPFPPVSTQQQHQQVNGYTAGACAGEHCACIVCWSPWA
ncbi:hypothetical protein C8F01DRAFT_1372796 [Mycena amicta]|nr:hypothetical protein C8F01DRAFT_1372796 [Mycena amicta]